MQFADAINDAAELGRAAGVQLVERQLVAVATDVTARILSRIRPIVNDMHAAVALSKQFAEPITHETVLGWADQLSGDGPTT